MCYEFNDLNGEVTDKQARFQARAARESLLKAAYLAGGQDGLKPPRPGWKRPWRPFLRFKFGR